MAKAVQRDNVGSVYIATPSPDMAFSMTRGSHWSLQKPPGSEFLELPGTRSEYARTRAIQNFYNDTTHEWILLLDSDMDPEPDALMTLLSHDKPIVTGMYLTRGGEKVTPVIRRDYDAIKTEEWPSEVFVDYPKDALFTVGATGFGFLLMHRSVFPKMWLILKVLACATGLKTAAPWAYYGIWRGESVGGDLAFCDWAKLAGLEIWCDSRVFVRHLYPDSVTKEEYERAREATLRKGEDGAHQES